jgi:hypothetical protein
MQGAQEPVKTILTRVAERSISLVTLRQGRGGFSVEAGRYCT